MGRGVSVVPPFLLLESLSSTVLPEMTEELATPAEKTKGLSAAVEAKKRKNPWKKEKKAEKPPMATPMLLVVVVAVVVDHEKKAFHSESW